MVKACISATPSFWRLSSNSKYAETYLVYCERSLGKLQPQVLQLKQEANTHKSADAGDCGSWVVDSETCDLYGHVVAGQRNGSTVYVAPAVKIVKEIEQATGCSVSIPLTQVTQTLQTGLTDEPKREVESAIVANHPRVTSRHDESPSNSEIDSEEAELNMLQAKWEENMKDFGSQRRYTRVAVLLLYWDNVEESYLDTRDEVRPLNA